jgi:uncharacterized protein (UPF0210 family)
MKIRSITYFDHPGDPVTEDSIKRAGAFSVHAREIFPSAGFEVQTIRFASPPFPLLLGRMEGDHLIDFALQLEALLQPLGYDYISLGPALPSHLQTYSLLPDLIAATEHSFCSGMLTEGSRRISLPAVRACGQVIHSLSTVEDNGFANLYFAALGNVPPGAPFFPAAYHTLEGTATFAVAVEAADLAAAAFSSGKEFSTVGQELVSHIEKTGRSLSGAARTLSRITGAAFGGIDFSPAPFPDQDHSIGGALENLGLEFIGGLGSVAAAALLADLIDQAEFPRTGFSGLMLPVLEDSVLAQRWADSSLGVKDLLLYAAVCGTGLDTVPLAGDTTPSQISALLFDLAALSTRLNKPLTARLMPIPGKKAGDPTSFDFPFFANSRVMELQTGTLGNCFEGEGYLEINPRNRHSGSGD